MALRLRIGTLVYLSRGSNCLFNRFVLFLLFFVKFLFYSFYSIVKIAYETEKTTFPLLLALLIGLNQCVFLGFACRLSMLEDGFSTLLEV